jgi:hypothetical protein
MYLAWNKIRYQINDEKVWIFLRESLWNGFNETFGKIKSNTKL